MWASMAHHGALGVHPDNDDPMWGSRWSDTVKRQLYYVFGILHFATLAAAWREPSNLPTPRTRCRASQGFASMAWQAGACTMRCLRVGLRTRRAGMAPCRRASPDHRRCTFEAVPQRYDPCPPLEAGLDSHYMRLALDQAHKVLGILAPAGSWGIFFGLAAGIPRTQVGHGCRLHHRPPSPAQVLAPCPTPQAASKGEVPIGAVLAAADGSLLASAHNEVEATGDPTAHAEMLCLRRAAGVAPSWRMPAATLYVTVEPCAMCAGGALAARLAAVVYGARSPLMGADGSWVSLLGRGPGAPAHPFHPGLEVRGGVLADECQRLMVEFFRARRRGEVRGPPGAGSPVQREAS